MRNEEYLFQARQEHVRFRERGLEDAPPVSSPSLGGGVRVGGVKRRGEPGMLRPVQHPPQVFTAVFVHPAHDRRVAEVEDPRLRQDIFQVFRQIFGGEGVVRTRMVEDHAVLAGRAEDHAVRGVLAGRIQEPLDQVVAHPGQEVAHDLAERVVGHLRQEPHRSAEPVEGQPRVRYAPTRRDRHRPDAGEGSGGVAHLAGQRRDKVQAEVSRHDHTASPFPDHRRPRYLGRHLLRVEYPPSG
jgi:hypothetical protein